MISLASLSPKSSKVKYTRGVGVNSKVWPAKSDKNLMSILHEFKIKVAEYLSRLNACYTELLKVKSLLLQEIKAFEIFKGLMP